MEQKDKAPLRILEVFREPIANGGQESFILNMYRNMDHKALVMDFMTPFTCDSQDFKKEVESCGSKIYAYNHPFGQKENEVFKESLQDFLQNHKNVYPVIHFHSGSTYALMEGPKLAKEAGIPVRIVHSHCGGFDNLKYRVIKTISIPYFMKYPTDFAACSNLAAAWKFPKKIIKDNNYTLFKNAVDLERFAWNPKIRKSMRNQLGIADGTIVLGHVGRFSLQKNHEFLIDIFNRYHKKNPDSVLLLIGVGEEQDKIRQKVKDLNLDNSVRFLNLQKNIPDYMNAMDVFVLPSFFEGLPVVGVEAQGCALPVVCSDQVTKELPVPDLSWYIPLGEDNLDMWIQAIEQAMKRDRFSRKDEMTKAGYEVKSAAKKMQDFYLERARKYA